MSELEEVLAKVRRAEPLTAAETRIIRDAVDAMAAFGVVVLEHLKLTFGAMVAEMAPLLAAYREARGAREENE